MTRKRAQDVAIGGDDGVLILPQRVGDPVVLQLAADEADCTSSHSSAALAVFVGNADTHHRQRQPMAGRLERNGRCVTFTPAFGFVAGQDYVVRAGGERGRLAEFRIPREEAPVLARVTGVYPSAGVLPENVLRFYLHFSVPMTPHLAIDFVALRDASDRVDRAAFMRFKQELWNADRTRLTVLIDPGRIKRKVATNLDLGPALLEGQRYELTIDKGWPSADGSSVLPSFSKRFRVGGALRERPNVERWSWQPPRPGTRNALRIVFDRPFDRHLLGDAICVFDSGGSLVAGTTRSGDGETSWSFTPDEPWATSDMRIVVNDALEDVAGNNLRELLDRDVGHRSAPQVNPGTNTNKHPMCKAVGTA